MIAFFRFTFLEFGIWKSVSFFQTSAEPLTCQKCQLSMEESRAMATTTVARDELGFEIVAAGGGTPGRGTSASWSLAASATLLGGPSGTRSVAGNVA